MDIFACLRIAAEALEAGELDDCREHLANARGWAGRGGFQMPFNQKVYDRVSAGLAEAEAAARK